MLLYLCNQKIIFEKVKFIRDVATAVRFTVGVDVLHPCVCMERGPADLSRNQNCNRMWLQFQSISESVMILLQLCYELWTKRVFGHASALGLPHLCQTSSEQNGGATSCLSVVLANWVLRP